MDEGTRLEVLDGLLPRVLEDANGKLLWVIGYGRLHQQDTLELVIDRQVFILLALHLSTLDCSCFLVLGEILLLTKLEVVKP